MGSCSALNCTNSSVTGYRMFNILAKIDRQRLYLQNHRRFDWETSSRPQTVKYVRYK